MLSALLVLAGAAAPAPLERDPFGVPKIVATTQAEGFFKAGYAAAEDRMWQMENSRRLARGRMAEVFGPSFVASDREVLGAAYTDAELKAQLDGLSENARIAFESYARGVNAYLEAAKAARKLPEGYAKSGFAPEPWTELDSAAIGIRLLTLFGRRGAGEVRNLALLGYLQNQSPAKERALDVFDDFLWQSDPGSIPTVNVADDPLGRKRPQFLPRADRETTEAHLALLPKTGLLELLPGIRLAERAESTRIAMSRAVPYKTGSYAVVVGPGRSANGGAMLLSAPQMGFSMPSVLYEMAFEVPDYRVSGVTVPGVPGVVIGATPEFAWGLTTGVADTDDVFVFTLGEGGKVRYGKETRPVEILRFPLRVKNGPAQTVEQKRTGWGPVVVDSPRSATLYVRRSASWMAELGSFQAILDLPNAKTADEIERAVTSHATVNFNFFYATRSGDIGYRFLGRVPIRAEGYDPRLPVPARPEFDWRGFLPVDDMPRVRNPRGGLIANWNNKPASWWPNGDTPAWGAIFRNELLLDQLKSPKLTVADVETSAWAIARGNETWNAFRPLLEPVVTRVRAAAPLNLDEGLAAVAYALQGFDGRRLEGSIGAAVYAELMVQLPRELLLPQTGNFLSPDNFRMVAQPSVVLQALRRRTKVDYLGARTADQVIEAAMRKTAEALRTRLGAEFTGWRFAASTIRYPDLAPIPYSDRGTYIQIIELGGRVSGRNVLPPGNAESGPHARDQADLARAFGFKRMAVP